MSVKKVYMRGQFFNTRWPVRYVNANYGPEWFRMYLDGLHVLDPTQFPASFITRFTDSPLWHGTSVLTQTVWEHMSIKYNRDTVAPAEFVHTVYPLFSCAYACDMPLPLRTCVCYSHAAVNRVNASTCVC